MAGRAHRSHRRQTDGYSGACVKRLSFYLLHSHTHTHTNKRTHTHTHTRMVLLTSCFAFIGLKCEIANKYQEFLSFLYFLSSFSRVTLATTLPGLLNYLLGFFLFTVKRSSIALVCVLALVSCICEILSIVVPPGSSISKLPLTRLPHCNCSASLSFPFSLS